MALLNKKELNGIMSGIEFEFLYFLQSLHTPWLDLFMKTVTSLGDHGFIWIVIGIGLLCIKKTRMTGLCVLLSLAAGYLMGNIFLKNFIARDRPSWLDDSLLQNVLICSFSHGYFRRHGFGHSHCFPCPLGSGE